jgi:hypothetical protein
MRATNVPQKAQLLFLPSPLCYDVASALTSIAGLAFSLTDKRLSSARLKVLFSAL